MVLTGMRGSFEQRGLLDGMGDIGFDAGGFLKDIGSKAAAAALSATAQKLSPSAPKPAAPKPAAKSAIGGLSTGAKIAIGGVALVGILLVVRGRGRK